MQNKKRTETETEDEDEDDEEMPEDAGKTYDTSKKDGRYAPIQTDPENDVIQIHTDGEMPQGENSQNKYRRSNRNTNKPNKYGSIPYKGTFWVWKSCLCYRPKLDPNKGHTQANTGNCTKAARLLAGEHDATRHIFKPLKNPGERKGNVIRFIRQLKEHDLYRISVADTPVYCLQTLDVKLLHPFMLKRYC